MNYTSIGGQVKQTVKVLVQQNKYVCKKKVKAVSPNDGAV